MGDRYFLTVMCPKCGLEDSNVYYAPTCGFTEHRCPCGHSVDLEEYTGISHEGASNRDVMEKMIAEQKRKAAEELKRTTPSNAELLKLAGNYEPPQEWYDE